MLFITSYHVQSLPKGLAKVGRIGNAFFSLTRRIASTNPGSSPAHFISVGQFSKGKQQARLSSPYSSHFSSCRLISDPYLPVPFYPVLFFSHSSAPAPCLSELCAPYLFISYCPRENSIQDTKMGISLNPTMYYMVL